MTAEEGSAIRVLTATGDLSTANNVLVGNAGTLTGAGGLLSPTVGVGADGNAFVVNAGTIQTVGSDPEGLAVGLVAGGFAGVLNTGVLTGRVNLASIDGSGLVNTGDWTTSGPSLLASLNSNTLVNTETGAIRITNGSIGLASVSGNNRVVNAGLIEGAGATTFGLATVTGDNSLSNSGEFIASGVNTIGMATVTGDNTIQNEGEVRLSDVNTIGMATVTGGNVVANGGDFHLAGLNTIGMATERGDNEIWNAGTFSLSGLSTVGMATADGSNVFNNAGVFASAGVTTFAMAATGDNTVNNTGVMQVDGRLRFLGGAGLQFNNAGGFLDMRDGDTNDRTYVSGDFNGGVGSRLGVDAFLGGPGSTADMLVVRGATTGVTSVVVNDVNPGPGAYNPTGIPFAYSITGQTQLGNFVLDPASDHYDPSRGVLDKGLFFYDIAVRPGLENPDGRAQVLISAPDREVFELPRAVTGAQNIWHESTGVWLDRQADLRRQLMSPPAVAAVQPYPAAVVRKGYDEPTPAPLPTLAIAGSGAITPGVWAKTVGSWTNRSDSERYSIYDRTYSFDLGYRQSVLGIIGGVDFGVRGMSNPNDALIFGAMAGYLTSDLDFKGSRNGFNYKGATVGLYATYINNGFFVDVLGKADLLDMKWQTPSLVGLEFGNRKSDANSYGVRIDSGYRWSLNPTFFIEPSATLAYVRTDIDAIDLGGATIGFEDGKSLRGALGLRAGAGLVGNAAYTLEASVTGRVWNEFEAKNSVALTGFGPSLYVRDPFDGVFGEVTGSLNLFSNTSGWSGFLNAGVKFNDDFTTTSVKGGVRYVFGGGTAPVLAPAPAVVSVRY